MGCEIIYIDDGEGIEIIFTGKLTFNDLREAYEELYNEQNIYRQKYQIGELSGVDSIDLSSEDIRVLAQLDIEASKKNPNIIIANIGKSELEFGLSRMWEMLADECLFEIEVFRNREDAKKWIESKLKT